MTTSEALSHSLRSLRGPIEKFLQDGIWRDTNNWNDDKLSVGHTQVRSIGREVARLHKRPFIRYEEYYMTDDIGGRYLRHVNLFIPRQKRLVGHISPLLLCHQDPTGGTLWEVRQIEPDLWRKILHNWLTDPDLRAARKAPPL